MESDIEKSERIQMAGIGSPEYFGEVFRLLTSFQAKEEWSITDPERVSNLTAAKLGITLDEVNSIYLGKSKIPLEEQLLDWTKRLSLPNDIVDDLLISAGYLPTVPELTTEQWNRVTGHAIGELITESRETGFTGIRGVLGLEGLTLLSRGKERIGGFVKRIFHKQ